MKKLLVKLFVFLWKESGIAAEMEFLQNQIGPQLDNKLQQIEKRAKGSYENTEKKIKDLFLTDALIQVFSTLSKKERAEITEFFNGKE